MDLKSARELYRYHVPYKRRLNWYPTVWRELSDWCTETYGWGHWEYIDEKFMFETEEQKTLFVLRWL